MSNKDLLNNIIEYVCFSEDLIRCSSGIYPECREVGCGCYALLRETEKRFDLLENIEKMINEVKNE